MMSDLTPSFARAVTAKRQRREPATRPFSIRLSESERQTLESAAGSIPLGTFVRSRLLGTALPRGARRRGTADSARLSQILGLLGRSGLSSGLADLGVAARSGTIALTAELEAQIIAACADIQEVRRLLLCAIGLPLGERQ